MGVSASKAASKGPSLSAVNTARKYPTRSPPAPPPGSNASQRASRPASPTVHPDTRPAGAQNGGTEHNVSALDRALDQRLRNIGPVQPNPTYSNSSTFHAYGQTSSIPSNPGSTGFQPSASSPSQSIFPASSGGFAPQENPALSLLTARYRLQEEAEREFESLGRTGSSGRSFLDVVTLRQVLVLRDARGLSSEEIERKMELKKGTVDRLGTAGVFCAT